MGMAVDGSEDSCFAAEFVMEEMEWGEGVMDGEMGEKKEGEG